jgi:hypothetical protein
MLQAATPPGAGTPGSTPAAATSSVVADAKSAFDLATDAIAKTASAAIDLKSTWSKLDELSAEFVKNTGMGRERTIEMETSITQSATQILKFSEGIYTYEDALKKSAKIVGEISDATGRSLVGNAKEIEGIAVAMEATNVPSATLVTNFKQAGFALSAIPKEMQKVTDYTRSIGVNTAEVSGAVVANLKNLNLYNFDNGIQGLTKMVAQSALLGVNMATMFKISEDMFSPEKAIEMASSLQRLGVSTSALLDPLALMDMGQNNPAELQNQIVEMTKQFTYFDEKNQKFQILPGAQRQMREIGKELGIGADELARMALGSSELNKKMSEIRFPTLDTGPMSEEQKQMIANMSELRDGKYSVMVEQKDAQGFKTGIMKEKAITELSEEDIKTLSESSKPKALEDIAKEQLTALNRIAGAVTSTATAPKAALFGSAIGQAARGGAYRVESGSADIAGKALKPEELNKFVNDMTVSFKEYGKLMMEGDKEGAEKIGKGMEDRLKGVGEDGLKKAEEMFKEVSGIVGVEAKRFFHAGNPSATNTTQTTSQQSQEPKGSFMQQLGGNAFDNVNQGKAGESQPVTSSQVSNLNNQTVNTTNNNQQTSMNQSNVLTDVMSKALPPQIVEHKFDGTITIKVDVPPGVDSAYVTKTINDMVNSPAFTDKMMKSQEVMANNYGLTGGKVSAYSNTSGMGLG